MSCTGVQEETHVVVVAFPEPATAKLRRLRNLCGPRCCIGFAITFFLISVLFVMAFTLAVQYKCGTALGSELEDFSIRDMAVLHNVSTNSIPWQVTSDIHLTLSMRNPNTWARCLIALRHMEVSVHYHDNLISVLEIPLGFSLKRKRSRAVSAELKGERLQMSDEVGVALEALLRNDNVTLVLEVDTRYSMTGGVIEWSSVVNHKVCEVVATTPQGCNSGHGSLLGVDCEEEVDAVA